MSPQQATHVCNSSPNLIPAPSSLFIVFFNFVSLHFTRTEPGVFAFIKLMVSDPSLSITSAAQVLEETVDLYYYYGLNDCPLEVMFSKFNPQSHTLIFEEGALGGDCSAGLCPQECYKLIHGLMGYQGNGFSFSDLLCCLSMGQPPSGHEPVGRLSANAEQVRFPGSRAVSWTTFILYNYLLSAMLSQLQKTDWHIQFFFLHVFL